jgi:hypothetical protein
LLEVGLQTSAVLTLEGTQLVDLLLQSGARSGQLRHDLLMLGFCLALGILCLAARRCQHRVRF